MKLNLTVDEALSTTRAVRKRLDFDRPVEPEIIRECLESVVQSPTGSNSQSWQWMVITDQAQRSALAGLYRQGWEIYVQMEGNVETAYKGEDPSRLAQQDRVASSAQYLAENFEKAAMLYIKDMNFDAAGHADFFESDSSYRNYWADRCRTSCRVHVDQRQLLIMLGIRTDPRRCGPGNKPKTYHTVEVDTIAGFYLCYRSFSACLGTFV